MAMAWTRHDQWNPLPDMEAYMESNLEYKVGSRAEFDERRSFTFETFQVKFWPVFVHLYWMTGDHLSLRKTSTPSGIRIQYKPIPRLERSLQENLDGSTSKDVLFLWNCFQVRNHEKFILNYLYFKNWPLKSSITWNAIARDEWW